MSIIIVLFVLSIVFSLIAIASAYKKWMPGLFLYFVLAHFCGLGSIKFAVENVGYGHVPEVAEPLSKRLSVGVFYQVIGSIKDGNEDVVFVKPFRGGKRVSELYAIRAKEGEVPPTYFTMIGDKPVAIMIPR